MPGGRATRWLHLLLIATVTFAAYSNSFDGEFVSDDTVNILEDDSIRSLDREHLLRVITTFDDANYIPVTSLTFALDYHFTQLDPTGYHVTNLLIHIGCAALLYGLLLHLALPPPAAVLVALLWAVHPLQVESVAWISERKNVLSGLFFFAAFLVYVRFSARPSAWRYLGTLVLLALALLSKMNTMVLPALCLVYEWTIRQRLRWRDVAAALPMLALAAATAAYNLIGNPIHGTAWHGGSVWVSWLSSFVVFFRYLGKIVLPVHLSSGYDVPLRGSLLDPAALAATLGVLALGGLTVWLLARRRPEAFWMLWLAICLAPMLNLLVPFRAMMQDRFMYLPLVGALGLGAVLVLRVDSARIRRLVAGAAIVAIAACTVLTHRQVRTWQNSVELWKPIALGMAYYAGDPGSYRHPDTDARVAFLEGVLARDPLAPFPNGNLAATLASAGDVQRAIPLYERAARHAPDSAPVLTNLANAYLHGGRGAEALPFAQRAVALEPYQMMTQLTLLRAALVAGDVEEARRALAACKRIRPHAWAASAWRREQAFLEHLERERGMRTDS